MDDQNPHANRLPQRRLSYSLPMIDVRLRGLESCPGLRFAEYFHHAALHLHAIAGEPQRAVVGLIGVHAAKSWRTEANAGGRAIRVVRSQVFVRAEEEPLALVHSIRQESDLRLFAKRSLEWIASEKRLDATQKVFSQVCTRRDRLVLACGVFL